MLTKMNDRVAIAFWIRLYWRRFRNETRAAALYSLSQRPIVAVGGKTIVL